MLEKRVNEVLDQLRPYLETDGVDCDLIRIEDGIAYIELTGGFVGCAAILMNIKLGIEKRLMEELPDAIQAVEIA